jgi:hypothetical protein
MPFPYAYYQTYYNGPVNAETLKAKALYLTPATIASSGGSVDVAGKSVIAIDTTAGAVTINNFIGGQDGQVLFIYKTVIPNILTIKHAFSSADDVRMANLQDLVMGGFQLGGILLVCRNNGGINSWYQIDTNGYYSNGTVAKPSIAFANDTDSGLYRKSSNVIGFSIAGLQKMEFATAYLNSMVQHLFADGTASLPGIAFANDTSTGFRNLVDSVGFTSAGVDRLFFYKNGSLGVSNPDIRSATAFRFLTVNATVAQKVYTGGLLASDNYADASLIPANGIYSKGNVKTAGQFQGTATSALFADLAERYKADKEYAAGTLVSIGGTEEITETNGFGDTEVFGIVSDKPAFAMNNNVPEGEDEKLWPYIALAGRVPCKVTGKIKKGERIIPGSKPGFGQGLNSAIIALKATDLPYLIVGRSLEDKNCDGDGIVEVAIGGLK